MQSTPTDRHDVVHFVPLRTGFVKLSDGLAISIGRSLISQSGSICCRNFSHTAPPYFSGLLGRIFASSLGGTINAAILALQNIGAAMATSIPKSSDASGVVVNGGATLRTKSIPLFLLRQDGLAVPTSRRVAEIFFSLLPATNFTAQRTIDAADLSSHCEVVVCHKNTYTNYDRR